MRRRFRPFRLGLWFGVLVAAGYLVARYARSRDALNPASTDRWDALPPSAEPATWRAEAVPPLERTPVVEAPVVTTPAVAEAEPAPTEAVEPEAEPAPTEAAEPAPVKKAVAKKSAAAKKAAPAKKPAKKSPPKKA